MADQGGNNSQIREYRKGNWTVSETMVLIEAKRMDDERRTKRSSDSEGGGGGRSGKPTELRWKWVEDYCWRKGCLRTQNQCNDKWDNLMRDYKKVREYERRIAESRGDGSAISYWKLEKNERKDKKLPSNMLPQIYEALVEVVERRGSSGYQRSGGGGGGCGSGSSTPRICGTVQTSSLPPLLQHQGVSPPIPVLPLPPPPPPQAQPTPPVPPPPQQFSQPLPTVGTLSPHQ